LHRTKSGGLYNLTVAYITLLASVYKVDLY